MAPRAAGHAAELLTGDCLDYIVVDVFVGPSELPYSGNPLAVVLGGDGLTTDQCQAIAGEFHLSETVFPMTATDPSGHYRARIFTIASELPFAGHPSVGVAWTLGQLGLLAPGKVVQECIAGLVDLDLPANGGAVTLTGPLPTIGDPVDAAPLLAAVGLTEADLGSSPPRIGGSGVPFAFLNVRPEALATTRLDPAALDEVTGVTGILLFTVIPAHRPVGALEIRARMFAGDLGGEDPATGSAALGLGGYLVASGIAADDGETAYSITQGVEMGRPSELMCDVTAQRGSVSRVRVRGRVAIVAIGRIRLPDQPVS